MSTYIKERQSINYQEGREAELLFRKWTGAKDAPRELELRHIDCIWNDKTVDVKGFKKSQSDGYVLVEFRAVDGRDGWCSRNSADKIAFLFDNGFVVVDTMDLRSLAEKKALANPLNMGGKVTRANRIGASAGLYLLCGRDGRKDVFTYITKQDLLSLDHQIVNGITK